MGLFHHSGDRDIDYVEIARILCRKLERRESLVEPSRGANMVVPPVVLPRHTTLAQALPSGFAPQEAESTSIVLGEFFDRHRAEW
jgi:hypothetical protein